MLSTSVWRSQLARDHRSPVGFLKPCLLTSSRRVPAGPEWQFEVKHDGYRMIARAGRTVRIWSRHGRSWTGSFSVIAQSLAELGREIVIDGEAVNQLADGRSDFHSLAGHGAEKAALWAFDLLIVDGKDIRDRPLEERREQLQRILDDAKPQGIAFSEHHERDGEALFDAACRMGLEGIVAKRRGSRYVAGKRSSAWMKVKNPDFVRP